jgi:hypothetical protein
MKNHCFTPKLIPLIALALTSSAIVCFYVFSSPVKAASSATVTATVTVQNISVTVSDGTVAYGTLGTSTSAGTNGTDTQTATNNGNVTEDLLIKGQNTTAWTLGATSSSDQYIHRFCSSSCASPPTSYTALTTSNQTLAASKAASATQTFDLYITTPSSSSSFTQQSVDVIVTATAS